MFDYKTLVLSLVFLFLLSTKNDALNTPPFLSSFKKNELEHAIYLGTIHIQHLSHQSTATVRVKVFQDDLQDVIHHAFRLKKIEKETAFYIAQAKDIEQYFQTHLTFYINEQAISLHLKKIEAQNEAYELLFEITCPTVWEMTTIRGDFLMELFPTQSNVLQLEHGEEKRFGRFKIGEEILQFKF